MFYIKDKNKSVTAIEAIVSIGGRKFKYATGLSVEPEFWNKEEHRAQYNRKYTDGKEINERLKKLEGVITDVVELYKYKVPPTPGEFREKVKGFLLTGGNRNDIRLIDYIESYYKGAGLSYNSSKNYTTCINNLKKYQKKYKKTLYLQDVNIEFYYHFRAWFYSLINSKTELPYTKNYFGAMVKVFIKVMNHANESGNFKTDAHLHSQFKAEKEVAETVYLTDEELLKIYGAEITEEAVKEFYPKLTPDKIKQKMQGMELARPRFLIGAYTALRVSDFKKLVETDVSGRFLRITTKKTMAPVVVPMHRIVREIIDSGVLFATKQSEQKINKHIKEVCRLAGITEPVTVTRSHGGRSVKKTVPKFSLITTHTARRSAATNFFKAGIPAISIMKITGHTTEKAFMKYIKISVEENAEMLAKHPYFQ